MGIAILVNLNCSIQLNYLSPPVFVDAIADGRQFDPAGRGGQGVDPADQRFDEPEARMRSACHGAAPQES